MNFLATQMAAVGGLALLIGSVGWSAESAPVIPNPAKPAPNGHRFLFVVETSADNRKFEDANRQAVFDLVVGAVYGHMRTGDTFGIWTFNDDVRIGEFPMTVYDADRALEIGGQAAAFLQSRRYSKKPDFAPVVKQLRALSDTVANFNVFILTSGQNPIEGTPFDQNINTAFEAYKKRPAKLARLPLITSFAVRQGRPSRGSVVLAGNRISLPERPPPVAQIQTSTTNAPPAAPAGNTAETAVAVTKPLVPSPAEPRPKLLQIITHSNPPQASITSAQEPPLRSSPLRRPAGERVGPTDREGPGEVDQSQVATTHEPSSPPKPFIPTASIPPDPSNGSTLSEIASAAAPRGESLPGPAASKTRLPLPTTNATSIANATNDTPPAYSVTSVARILSAAADAAAGSPMTVTAREPRADRSGASEKAPAPAAAAPPVLPAVATLPMTTVGLTPATLLAIGGALLGATFFLVVLVLRRTPSPTRGSLISQSMRRD